MLPPELFCAVVAVSAVCLFCSMRMGVRSSPTRMERPSVNATSQPDATRGSITIRAQTTASSNFSNIYQNLAKIRTSANFDMLSFTIRARAPA